jgi:hypothetical protein
MRIDRRHPYQCAGFSQAIQPLGRTQTAAAKLLGTIGIKPHQ